MQWTYIILALLAMSCSHCKEDSTTEIVYVTDTVYIESTIKVQPLGLSMSNSAKTSLDLNICSLERFLIADSILTQVYDSIISHYHSETSPLETTQAVLDRKLHFERAHSKFLQYRESIEEFISFEFDEARMAPFHTNAYILEATINQIKLYQTLEAEVIY